MPARRSKTYAEDDEDYDDASAYSPYEDEEHLEPQVETKGRSQSNPKPQRNSSPNISNDDHLFPCTFAHACGNAYKTRTGLRKHINAVHTHAISYACPYPGCDFVRPAKETIIRHLQGLHKMPELPTKGKDTDWRKVEREQVRIFREHVGEGVDVSFFLTISTAEDVEEEEGAVAEHEEEVEGGEETGHWLFVDPAEDDEEQSDDSDTPLANRTRSRTRPKTTRAPPTPSTPSRPSNAHKFNHTLALHTSLINFANSLRTNPSLLNWPQLWDMLSVEGTDRDDFKQFCERNHLVREHGERKVAMVVSGEMEYWLMRDPFVEVSLSRWLHERLEEV